MGNPVLIKTLLTSVVVLTGVVAGLLAVILAKT